MVKNLEEKVQVVSDKDEPVGGAVKKEIWEKGLYHRIVRIMISNPSGEFLLQKRDPGMQLWPATWDNASSGHVDEGEDYEVAAKRELSEELGIEDVELKEIAYYSTQSTYEWRKLNRFVKLYHAEVPADVEIKPEKGEVTETIWATKDTIKNMVHQHPEQASDGLIDVYERFISKS